MKWFIALFTLIISLNSFASEQCINDKLTIILSRGANTSSLSALAYGEAVKQRIIDLYKDGSIVLNGFDPNNIQVVITNNEPEGGLEELAELWVQFQALRLATKYNPDGSAIVDDIYRDKLSRVFGMTDPVDYNDMEAQIALYKYVLQGIPTPGYEFPLEIANSNAIVIAHSQGNMTYEAVYNAYMYNYPELKRRYKVLSLGTPVVLSEQDAYALDVTDPLQVIGFQKWNVKNDIAFWDAFKGFGHSFYHYINGVNSEDDTLSSKKIINNFLIDSMNHFNPKSYEYLQKVTMSYYLADADFHVLEQHSDTAIYHMQSTYEDSIHNVLGAPIRGVLEKTGPSSMEYTIKCSDIGDSSLPSENKTSVNLGVWQRPSGYDYPLQVTFSGSINGSTTYETSRVSDSEGYDTVVSITIIKNDDGSFEVTDRYYSSE